MQNANKRATANMC